MYVQWLTPGCHRDIVTMDSQEWEYEWKQWAVACISCVHYRWTSMTALELTPSCLSPLMTTLWESRAQNTAWQCMQVSQNNLTRGPHNGLMSLGWRRAGPAAQAAQHGMIIECRGR